MFVGLSLIIYSGTLLHEGCPPAWVHLLCSLGCVEPAWIANVNSRNSAS